MKRALYSKILKACRAAHASGIPIRRGDFGAKRVNGKVAPKKCGVCALSAAVLGREAVKTPWYPFDIVATIIEHLDINDDDICRFTLGFDESADDIVTESLAWSPFYKAGRRLAKTLEREGILP